MVLLMVWDSVYISLTCSHTYISPSHILTLIPPHLHIPSHITHPHTPSHISHTPHIPHIPSHIPHSSLNSPLTYPHAHSLANPSRISHISDTPPYLPLPTHPHHTAGPIHCSGWVFVAALSKLTSMPTPVRRTPKSYSKSSTSK